MTQTFPPFLFYVFLLGMASNMWHAQAHSPSSEMLTQTSDGKLWRIWLSLLLKWHTHIVTTLTQRHCLSTKKHSKRQIYVLLCHFLSRETLLRRKTSAIFCIFRSSNIPKKTFVFWIAMIKRAVLWDEADDDSDEEITHHQQQKLERHCANTCVFQKRERQEGRIRKESAEIKRKSQNSN